MRAYICPYFVGLILLGNLSCAELETAGRSGSESEDPAPTETDTTDTTAPVINNTSPAEDATDVATNTVVTATFSENILAASLTSTSFTLMFGTNSVAGSISFDDNTNIMSFTPAASLGLNRKYTATATTGITDLAENALAETSWEFTTIEGAWQTADLIEADAGFPDAPQISVGENGHAFAVWHQDDSSRDNIWSNRYVEGTGWGTAELIETDNAGYARNPQVAVDTNGNAIAVWHQHDGTRTNIWSNRYVEGTGWGTAELIETDNTSSALNPQIAVDTNGHAVAVWSQYDGTRHNIWSNRYTVGSGWGTAELIETDNAGTALVPQVAVDASGNAVAVWQHFDGTRNNIWSNRYVAGTGWGTAELIETDNAGTALSPQVAVDASGNALAVWQHYDGTRNNIWSNRYVAGTGWGTAELIETDNTGTTVTPQVTVNASGNAAAVWAGFDGTRSNIWSNRYVVGTGWGTPELIEMEDGGSASNPQIAMDAGGNALAVWDQYDGTSTNISSNRYVLGTGWGTEELIETDNTGTANIPQIAMSTNGRAFAVWKQQIGTLNIYANRFE